MDLWLFCTAVNGFYFYLFFYQKSLFIPSDVIREKNKKVSWEKKKKKEISIRDDHLNLNSKLMLYTKNSD